MSPHTPGRWLNGGPKFVPMKNKKSTKGDKTAVTNTAKELRELMEQKPCYTPFSLEAIIDAGTPKKPSMQSQTSDLVARLRTNAQELLNRAFAGEPDAIKEFCWFAHNLIRQLTYLSEKKQKEISEIASTYEDWPILYAPDDDSQGIYEKLGVGAKYTARTNSVII